MTNALEIVELARKTGKIRKGTNEATNSVERGQALVVVVAKDVSPAEVVMHLPLICKEKEVKFAEVDSKEELGAAAGLGVGTAAVAVTKAGEAKDLIKSL